jgi:threonyl-tRNA synthetase
VSEAEAAFYGPKIEMHLKDALNRSWQLGTIQLDQAMPERFNLRYISNDGSEQQPTMIHRALLGSLERFIGIYLEFTAGKLPFWLSPTQLIIIPITDKHIDYCYEVQSEYKQSMINAIVDDGSERMGAKIRNAQIKKIPYMFIVGDQEMESNTVAVRTRNGDDLGQIKREDILATLIQLKQTRTIELIANTSEKQ